MKRKKFTPAEKLAIIQEVESGLQYRKAAKKYGTGTDTLVFWKQLYKRYGMDGLEDRGLRYYSTKFKKQIVKSVLEEGLPLRQVALENRVKYGTVASMCWRVRRGGYEVLNPKPKQIKPMKQPARNKPTTFAEAEEAIEKLCKQMADKDALILRQQAELALIKKVKALTKEREAKLEQLKKSIQSGQSLKNETL